MRKITPESEAAIRAFLIDALLKVRLAVLTVTGEGVPDRDVEALYESDFGQKLQNIALAAEGRLRYSAAGAGVVRQNCDTVLRLLWSAPGMPDCYPPFRFWLTPMGTLILHAQVWADQDELITMSKAAEESGRSLSSLSQLVSRGRLAVYPDPAEPNPRRRQRVRLSDVRRLALA